MQDLFSSQPSTDNFHWIVAMFRADGAPETIRRANDVSLSTYYPIRFNGRGEPKPLWMNYLFIEYKRNLTLSVCRATSKFLKILNTRDEYGRLTPALVRHNAINESLELVKMGKFNDKSLTRRFYGKGAVVRVIDGTFLDKRVRLEMDIPPNLPSNRKILININGLRGSIEIWKLSL
jgi:hypothetical protein